MSISRDNLPLNQPSTNMVCQPELAQEAESVQDEAVRMVLRQDAESKSEGMELDLYKDNKRGASRMRNLKFWCIPRQVVLKISQEASTFRTRVVLKDGVDLDQGNKTEIAGIIEGQVEQKGSAFEGEINAQGGGKIRQGNTMTVGRMNF